MTVATRRSHAGGWVIAALAIQYIKPLLYPAPVEVGVGLIGTGRTSFRLGYGLFAGQSCAAVAETRSVYVDKATGKSVLLPEDFAARISTLIGELIAEVVGGLRKNGEQGDAQVEASVLARVEELCAKFPIYPTL